MARDLHDVIASHLSAIAIHSGAALAARRTRTRPGRARARPVQQPHLARGDAGHDPAAALGPAAGRGAARAVHPADQPSEQGEGTDRLGPDDGAARTTVLAGEPVAAPRGSHVSTTCWPPRGPTG
ncbi:histidine kinase [Oerskovia sp. M15]